MNFYGYKNHVKVDKGTKLIRDYMATDASVHDSQELEILIDKSDVGQSSTRTQSISGRKQSLTTVA